MSQLRVLFIAGLGRSGTTLLEQALGQHADTVVLGETLHLWKRGLLLDERCGCGRPFSKCQFWTDVGKHAFGGWDRIDPHRVLDLRARIDRVRRIGTLARRQLPRRDEAAVHEYVGYFRRIHAAAARLTGASVVVDSSKQITLAFCLSHLPDYDVRVLHCVRDSRAVAHAWSKVVQRPDSDDPASQMDRYHPAVTAFKWSTHNAVVPLLKLRDIEWMRSRYEDFATRPGQTLREVAEFARLDPAAFRDGSIGEGWLKLHPTHTVSGNPVRFQSGQVTVRRDDRWRSEMPRRSRWLVSTLTWPLLVRYHYELRTGAQ